MANKMRDQILKLGLDIPAIFMMECFEFHWQDGNAQFYGQISQQIPRLLPAKLWRIITTMIRLYSGKPEGAYHEWCGDFSKDPLFFFTSGLIFERHPHSDTLIILDTCVCFAVHLKENSKTILRTLHPWIKITTKLVILTFWCSLGLWGFWLTLRVCEWNDLSNKGPSAVSIQIQSCRFAIALKYGWLIIVIPHPKKWDSKQVKHHYFSRISLLYLSVVAI